MIVDFDDWSYEHDCRMELEKLKEINPLFKVTLFTIPAKTTIDMLSWAVDNEDWIELAVHGWNHNTNTECLEWSYEKCIEVITNPIVQQFFVSGFKAPGWQISDDCYKACKDIGFWVADQDYNDDRRPRGLSIYKIGMNDYHGHTWDCGCKNGIQEDWKNIVLKIEGEQNFKFISEVVNAKPIL